MASKKSETFHFEKALSTLNELVDKMEHGNLPLEQSLAYFEQGVKLIRECQKALTTAEQKVLKLTEQHGLETLKPFDDSLTKDDE